MRLILLQGSTVAAEGTEALGGGFQRGSGRGILGVVALVQGLGRTMLQRLFTLASNVQGGSLLIWGSSIEHVTFLASTKKSVRKAGEVRQQVRAAVSGRVCPVPRRSGQRPLACR